MSHLFLPSHNANSISSRAPQNEWREKNREEEQDHPSPTIPASTTGAAHSGPLTASKDHEGAITGGFKSSSVHSKAVQLQSIRMEESDIHLYFPTSPWQHHANLSIKHDPYWKQNVNGFIHDKISARILESF
ncbi:hypothetical protein MUK42_37235 [Musa troglodytarum]|uniref:Uncharacterized protein n=1 Tax=Musa troglodytarum TaxID=320322 RepID=A0A9E7FLW4_9LILI|nr:hypothetical protein MUK42_37235 [Musa troglodytarum]